MEIETSARLHLSLIDLNGSEGRIDGGIGLTLKDPSLIIECIENNTRTNVVCSDKYVMEDEYEKKIIDAYEKMKNYLGIDNTYTFNIKKIYPIHHGLGLGTQLALSTAKLVSEINDIDLDTYTQASVVGRGGTSGVGVYAFDKGGFIIDGGHKSDMKSEFLPSSASKVAPPPLIARYDFPEDWDILLITPNISQGSSGSSEVNIFKQYTPIAKSDVESISHITLMKLMPSIVEHDLDMLGEAISQIQNRGFKKIEKDLQSSEIHSIINYMHDNGINAAGMSSFGPTCFGIVDSNAKSLKHEILDLMDNKAEVTITKAKNYGSKIKK